MFKKLTFAAYAAVMMSFTTLAGNATWQLSSGHAFKGDGQACLYQTYTSNYDSDFGTIELSKVVAAFANGTLDLSSPPHYYDDVTGKAGVKGPVDVVDGVFTPQTIFLGNSADWYYSLVALVNVNGQEMLYVSAESEQGGEGKYTTSLSFDLGDAEYDAMGGYKGKGYYRGRMLGDYTIHFNGNSANATGVPNDIVAAVGTKPTLPSAAPVRAGWTFSGWTNAVNDHVYQPGGTFNEGCAKDTTFTLYAKWTEQTHSNLDFVDGDGSTWTYNRTGDEVTLTGFTPGATATGCTKPSTINGGTVVNRDTFDPMMEYANGLWWKYSIASGWSYVEGTVGAIPADLVIPDTLGGKPTLRFGLHVQSLFNNVENLMSVTFPSTFNTVYRYHFQSCPNLETVVFKGPLTMLGDSFADCPKLKEIEFPPNFTKPDGYDSFDYDTGSADRGYDEKGCRYADTAHRLLIAIDPERMQGAVVIPDGVVWSSGRKFQENKKMTSCRIPEGYALTPNMFMGSTLTEVDLPSNVTMAKAGYDAGTMTITHAHVRGGAPSWDLKSYFKGLTTITYPASCIAAWVDYRAAHPELEYVEELPETSVGDYVKYDLEADLGIEIGSYDKKEKVSAKGLPAGLKIVATKQKNKKKSVTNVVYTIEGVATAMRDYSQQPAYAVVTSGGKTTWQPILLSTVAQEVTGLGSLALGESVTVNACEWLPGVTNGWSVSGLPTGLKYTAKAVYSGSGKKRTLKYPAYTVYGKTTKAGLFTITAKKKVGSYYETLKYRVMVEPKAADAETFPGLVDVVATAYESYSNAVPAAVDKVSGLPAGLTFSAKDVYGYTNAKKKTGKYVKQAAQTIVGTPTKAGTCVVTYTKNVTIGKKKVAKTAQVVWTVLPNPVVPEVGFNVSGGVVLNRNAGSSYATGSAAAMTFNVTPGATVTASGLPKGLSLKQVADGVWAIAGTPAATGTSYVTLTAKLNGNTVAQSVAVKVNAHPLAGSYSGEVWLAGSIYGGTAKLTVGSTGKVSLSLVEKGVKTSATLSKVTAVEEGLDDPNVGKWECTFSLKQDKKKVLPKRTLTLVFTRKAGEWELPYCSTKSYNTANGEYFASVNPHRELSKADVAARVAAGRIPPLPTVETLAILAGVSGDSYGEPVAMGEVVAASATYKASTATYTVAGRLPDGKTFSASSPVLWAYAYPQYDQIFLGTVSVSNGAGDKYLLYVYLPYGVESSGSKVGMSGFCQLWGGKQEWFADSYYGLFGGDWAALPATVPDALGTIPEKGLRFEFFWRAAELPGEFVHEERRFKVVSKTVTEKKKKVTRHYASVSADGGETWVTSKDPISWSAGRASFNVALDGFTLTFDLALDKNGNLVGWARKSHTETDKKGKKTVVDAVGAAVVSDMPS